MGTMKEELLSFRVQTEYSLLAPAYAVSMPSDPLMWYPPCVAWWSASVMVMGRLLCPCGGTADKSLILHGYLKMTVLMHQRVESDRTLPALLESLQFLQQHRHQRVVLPWLLGAGGVGLCHLRALLIMCSLRRSMIASCLQGPEGDNIHVREYACDVATSIERLSRRSHVLTPLSAKTMP